MKNIMAMNQKALNRIVVDYWQLNGARETIKWLWLLGAKRMDILKVFATTLKKAGCTIVPAHVKALMKELQNDE